MYQRTYRQKRVLEVMSSQDSCASTVSSGDSSAASSGLSDRSLRRGASSCLNAIKHLGYEGQRKLFQRSEFIGVLGNHGFRPPCRAPEEGDVEVEVEGDDTSVGQPPTVPTCCISVMDKFLCSQQISDMSPFKKHQVRKRSWQFLREPVHVVHTLFNLQHPAHRMGLSTFYKRMKRVPWVKTNNKATTATSMVCACPYHVGFRWLLTAWNKMVCQADGDDDMDPLTREACLRVCGGSIDNLDCIEGRCGQCKLRMIRSPANVNADQPVPFNAFGYETYTTKKGEEAKRRVQVRNVLPAADFVSHFNKQLAVFRDHHFKSVFLAQQRANVWKNCPSDWIIMSIDWNSNYERKQNTTLTCQRSRSAILCPIVLLRWIDPINDPLLGQHHAVTALAKEKNLQPGDKLQILEAHIFVSSTTDHKGPATTSFMIDTILDFHKEHNIQRPKCIVMDTDNCAAQFKSALAMLSMAELGKKHKVDMQAFENVGNHGKGMSDGVGAAAKRCFDQACLGFHPLISGGVPQKEFGEALVDVGNKKFQPVEGQPAGRLVLRKFWNIPTTCTSDIVGSFRAQKDGMGNIRGMTNIYNFLYNHKSDKTLFRNLMCSCSPCLAGVYDECENKAWVAPPVQCKFVGVPEPECESDAESEDESEVSEVGSEDSFVESACMGLTVDFSDFLFA